MTIRTNSLRWNYLTDKYFFWRFIWATTNFLGIKMKRPVDSFKYNEVFKDKSLKFHQVLERLHEGIKDAKTDQKVRYHFNGALKHLIINYVTPRYLLLYDGVYPAPGEDLDITGGIIIQMLNDPNIPEQDRLILATMKKIIIEREEQFGDTITFKEPL